jgi:hypothetical protein
MNGPNQAEKSEYFEQTTWTKALKEWMQIFYQVGLGATALKVIKD